MEMEKILENGSMLEDHCEALLKVFQKGKIGEFYNIGSNKNLNNIIKTILKMC